MTNLFIDTNVFLNFFSFSKDHLNKLQELLKLVKNKDILLFLPEQVIDEFNRNRESTLKKVIEKLHEFPSKPESPVICHEFDQMKKIQKYATDIEKEITSLIKEIDKQIRTSSLQADKLISELFELARKISIDKDILDAARTRFDRGNPPGKNGSYGDAINWECLLAECPEKEALYFVGSDKDYISAIDSSEFSPFLKKEWGSRKNSNVFYFQLISQFIQQKFRDIKITEEQIEEEKEVAAQAASSSLLDSYGTSGYSGTSSPLVVSMFGKKLYCKNCGNELRLNPFTSPFSSEVTFRYRVKCPECGYVQIVQL